MKRPKHRYLAWAIAITYLLGLLNPPFAAPVSVVSADSIAHSTNEPAVGYRHEHLSAEIAPYRHDVGCYGDDCIDQAPRGDRHSGCCNSPTCLSAVPPEEATLPEFAGARSQCESEPRLLAAEEAFGRLYRPPIT